MSRMRLGRKLFIIFVLIGVIPALLLAAAVYYISAGVQEQMSNDSLVAYKAGVSGMVEAERKRLAMAGGIFMKEAGLRRALAEGDAAYFERLGAGMSPTDYIVVQDAAGKLLYTNLGSKAGMPAYSPEAFAVANHPDGAMAPSAAFPKDVDMRARFEVRGDNGAPAGSLYVGGLVFGFPFVDGAKSAFGIECTFFRNDERVYTTIVNNGQRAVGTKMTNPAVVDAVLARGAVYDSTNIILDDLYTTLYWPIVDGAGKNVGMYFIGLPMAVIEDAKTHLLYIVAGMLAAVVVLILIVARLTVTPITRTLTHIIDGLGSNSTLVNTAASEIRESSQSIAEGANTQASALEETSSALEQMASMTRQNADNTNQTNQTNHNTNERIVEGAALVRNMTSSMNEISDSASRISNIINTIEEIAFQTNLLALNAAVEAARAGEAGKGFAIVADEVRNLAQRSAQAARDTNDLITGTVERVRNGSRVAEDLQRSFREIETGSSTVSRLIGEITNATNEQAQGVDQVNTAVAQMDKVTQDNANNADHAAKSAAELSDAASVLDGMVGELVALVEGGASAAPAGPAAPASVRPGREVKLLGMS